MKLSLGDITISSISKTSGLFFGKENTLKQFRSESIVNEAVGSVTGNKNTIKQGHMMKNKLKEG
ncbi:hypothetical protein [Neobacillus mesonae]|uniref:hypothetical protein n=1 Tax=Neobacillus mesonae TaxID=1193713 RepID=UPI00203BAAA4|nr:hypothetical protein [Neobacillus mesonae]MCM3570997.1 hypothetical protein [Neobacillus mesonae]